MSLKNLIKLQQQKQAAAESPKAAPPTAAKVEVESPAVEQERQAPASAKPKGLGLNTVKVGTAFTPKAAAPKPAPVALDSDAFSLEDIAAMDAGAIPVDDTTYGSGFEDEIEATAPDRDLPAEMSAEQLSFVESLDSIYQVLHDAEMFAQTVRMIMLELQENREYDKLLSDSDVHVMIQGMRRSMGLAKVRKQEKSRKAGTNKGARKTSGVGDADLALLDSLMGGGD